MNYIVLMLCIAIQPLAATVFTVINTNDAGSGSLRDAITAANLDSFPPTSIYFNIPGAGPHTITPTTFYFNDPSNIQSLAFPPFTQTITLDATTQPGYSIGNPQIIIDFSIIASFNKRGNGFTILGADNCIIKGLQINSYVGNVSGRGISIQNTSSHGASGNQVTQCDCGNYNLFGNTRAIVIDGSASSTFPIVNTIIGGPNPTDGNVLSGNSIAGLVLEFNVYNSIVQNNKIGTDITGTVARPNAYAILLTGNATFPCNNNLIIDNVLAGNTLYQLILQNNSNFNIVQNNKIGTNSSGTAALGSAGIGVLLANDPGIFCIGNLIGGTGPNEGNVISGMVDVLLTFTADTTLATPIRLSSSPGIGMYLTDNVNSTTIIGNFIGTDITGTSPIPNSYGIYIQGDPGLPCSNNIIGIPGAGNVISYNTINGIVLASNVLDTSIQGNFIGTDTSATLHEGNGASGIVIQGTNGNPCTGNLIGGTTAGAKNSIVNNGQFGVEFSGDPTTPDTLNAIIGNSIYNNAGNGINLTNNANNLQEGPTLASFGLCCNGTEFSIGGFAPSIPSSSTFRLEFFTNPINSSPITEGQQLVGIIPTIASGQSFLLTFTSNSVSFLSATATDLNNSGLPGNTSEFTSSFTSVPLSCSQTIITAYPTAITMGNSSTLTATITGSGPFSITWSDGFTQTDIVATATHTVFPTETKTYSAITTDSTGCTMESENSATVTVSCPLQPFVAEKVFCNSNGQLILGRRGKNRILLQQVGTTVVESSFYAAPILDTFVGPITISDFDTMVNQGCTCN
jgi:hypothetical protein